MKILVYVNGLDITGSAVNAIDLALALKDRGHEISVLGSPGPLHRRLIEREVKCHLIRKSVTHPSGITAAKIRRLVGQYKYDIVHAYEWPATADAVAAMHPLKTPKIVSSVMQDHVHNSIPDFVPIIVGSERLKNAIASQRSSSVYVIRPPVDLATDYPQSTSETFVTDHQLRLDVFRISLIGRLDLTVKLPGVLSAITAMVPLADQLSAQLLIVGDGDGRPAVDEKAKKVNSQLGFPAAIVVGELLDAGPAYSAADVVVGMGSSAMRGLAFGKPVIVQGAHGYWRLCTPESAPIFLRDGFFGEDIPKTEQDHSTSVQNFLSTIQPVVFDKALRTFLGSFGRATARQHFSLTQATDKLEAIYEGLLQTPPCPRPAIA